MEAGGSVPIGFCIGFLGGCLGLALVHLAGARDRTKAGAGLGFATLLVFSFAIHVIARAVT